MPNDEKVFKGFMNVKDVQVFLQKTTTWTKKIEKGNKNGKRLALNVECHFKNSKSLSKLDLHMKSSCLKRP
jgi:hypothetical protein